MTLQEIKELKDKIYEIEGLLELAQLREDKIEELEPLILARISALSDKETTSVAEENAYPNVEPENPESLETAVEQEVEQTEPEVEEMEEDMEAQAEAEAEEPSTPQYPQPTGVITELFEENDSVSITRPANKPAFTLNDRFRFRRELFSNSDAEYSSAMNLIASMESYEEAEEYFLDELGWSLENPEVKDFMDIIQKYFG